MAVFDQIIESQNGYFADGWQYPLFFAALVLLPVIYRKKESWIFVVYTLVALAVIYCPFTAKIIMNAVGSDVYYRMFWVLPILYVMGVFIVEMFPVSMETAKKLLPKMKDKTVKILASFFLILIFAGLMYEGGHMVYERGVIGWGHNMEKLPADVIDVCDFINSDYEKDPVGEKRVTAVGTMVQYVRQYDATILQSYGRNTVYKGDHTKGKGRLYRELSSEPDPDYDYIEKMLIKTDSTYLVIADAGFVKASEMESRGFLSIHDNGTYTVLKRK